MLHARTPRGARHRDRGRPPGAATDAQRGAGLRAAAVGRGAGGAARGPATPSRPEARRVRITRAADELLRVGEYDYVVINEDLDARGGAGGGDSRSRSPAGLAAAESAGFVETIRQRRGRRRPRRPPSDQPREQGPMQIYTPVGRRPEGRQQVPRRARRGQVRPLPERVPPRPPRRREGEKLTTTAHASRWSTAS